MRIKDWFKGWRLYVILMAAALLIALVVINLQVFKTFILEFQTPVYFLFIAVAFVGGLCIGKAHTEEKQKTTDSAAGPATKDMLSDANSDTLNRIAEARSRFPLQYPNYQTTAPKLDADVRPWLKESGFAKNDRESHVIGTILSEEYRLSPDR